MINDIINILKDSYKKNWITPRDGNISYKSSDSNKFIITPSGLRKQDLKESDFSFITSDYEHEYATDVFN